MNTRDISFQKKYISIKYRDDSDTSVIDEFFVDHMYRSLDSIISNIQYQIIDVGAHIGVFSLYARTLNPNVKIIALEPHPDNIQLFEQNSSLNLLKNVHLLPYALSDSVETRIKLFISKNSHNHTTSSDHSTSSSSDHIQVRTISFDKLIEKEHIDTIGLLKMDIEGAEFDILKSFDLSIFRSIQYMAVEYHETQKNKRVNLENILREHGFSVEHFPNKFDKKFGLLLGRNKRIQN